MFCSEAAATIVGRLEATESVSVAMEDSFEEVIRQVEQACTDVDHGAGVVILVDIHGSSPFPGLPGHARRHAASPRSCAA